MKKHLNSLWDNVWTNDLYLIIICFLVVLLAPNQIDLINKGETTRLETASFVLRALPTIAWIYFITPQGYSKVSSPFIEVFDSITAMEEVVSICGNLISILLIAATFGSAVLFFFFPKEISFICGVVIVAVILQKSFDKSSYEEAGVNITKT